jgi:hypothetical protein
MSWTVGRVKITKIVETETVGSTRFILPLATHEEIQKLPWLIPDFATEDGRLKMSIHSLLVETPSRRIIVDRHRAGHKLVVHEFAGRVAARRCRHLRDLSAR